MEKKKKIIVDAVFAGLIILVVWLVSKYILPVLVPFIIALVIASILQILVRKIVKKIPNHKRQVSLIVVILFFALAAVGIAVLGIEIVNRIAGFVVALPSLYQNEIVPALDYVFYEVQESVIASGMMLAEDWDTAYNDVLTKIGNFLTDFSVNTVKSVSGGIAGIPEFIIKLVITVVSTVFFMLDYDMIMDFFVKCIPEGKQDTVLNFAKYIRSTLGVYAKSYTILFLMTYVELAVGFKILGIPYATVIGLAVAVFDILPVLGTGGVLLPWTVILFVMKNIPMAVGMLLLYLIITIVRNTVEPKIVGKQIGLHPLATLVAMYLGLSLLGFLGMFIFPVSLAVLINMKRNDD